MFQYTIKFYIYIHLYKQSNNISPNKEISYLCMFFIFLKLLISRSLSKLVKLY
jgi:hypothetical protein